MNINNLPNSIKEIILCKKNRKKKIIVKDYFFFLKKKQRKLIKFQKAGKVFDIMLQWQKKA